MLVLDIQQSLLALGYDAGPPDRVWSTQTRSAMIAFHKAHGFAQDRVVEPKTILRCTQRRSRARRVGL